MSVSRQDIAAAAERVRPYVHVTPVVVSSILNCELGGEVFFKCENLQRSGAFKVRGAVNAVLALEEATARCGVATHSSGNHGAALALAAQIRDVPAYVVMPENASPVKQAAVRHYGGRVTFCEPTLAAREAALEQVCAESGATFVPPYDDEAIIAGQATAALELLGQVDGLDALVVPVGGGGLLAGTALSGRYYSRGCSVYGAEPSAADDARQSLRSGGRVTDVDTTSTVADGLRTTLGERNFAIIREDVEDILLADEAQIVHWMRWVWTRMKLVVEPSAAVAVAALVRHGELVRGRRVGVVLSGGNVDVDHLPWA